MERFLEHVAMKGIRAEWWTNVTLVNQLLVPVPPGHGPGDARSPRVGRDTGLAQSRGPPEGSLGECWYRVAVDGTAPLEEGIHPPADQPGGTSTPAGFAGIGKATLL